jgi:hypothetical protein
VRSFSGPLYPTSLRRFPIANHPDFCDWGWAMNAGPGTRGAALAIDAGTLWLFDTYLKGEAPPFPTNAEIINAQRK